MLKKYIKKNKTLFAMLTNAKQRMKRIIAPSFLYLFFGSNRPISTLYGFDRGKAIDRFYIEKFLEAHAVNIKGDCLELLDNKYTIFYGKDRVTTSDILDIDASNMNATIIGDLRNLNGAIPDDRYDCIILTQVLQFIDDYTAAIKECKRILKPGGSLLITVPAIGRIDCVAGIEGDFWRFTEASLEYTLKSIFTDYRVGSFGNTKTGAAFWIGLSQEDIGKEAYDLNDKNFPVIITAFIRK